ncbi:ATP-binding cassette domain-containing protein [Limnohabitans radicicola]|uniref:ATP-binding cassette domain-containing protein n=1 Tax=Limnohabitans radicicola TaxID=2771427 RepID=A0A927FKH8_9BURK|nr:ATP-binding cassette domain-containing protein [Limnohabitans radicicola]MBD8051747.1 ATP-binding cassette domain-containing protein [Limnohabitans radicicola]
MTPTPPTPPAGQTLIACLMRLSQLRREPVDALQLQSLLREAQLPPDPNPQQLQATLGQLARAQRWARPQSSRRPDASRLPALVLEPGLAPALIVAGRSDNSWTVQRWNLEQRQFSEEAVSDFADGSLFVRLRMAARFSPAASPSFQLVWSEIWQHPRALLDVAAATVTVTVLALATSFYSMQVYDRVVPTQASATLLVLTLGVIASILLEVLGKWLRSRQVHHLTDLIDQSLARTVFGRFLNLRLDQLPPSVGATASRLRGYESIRGFLVSLVTQAMVDIPLALLTLLVLFFIGGKLALIPASFLVAGLVAGTVFQGRIEHLARQATPAQHLKSGLLVESIEGAETIKSGQGGWRMLSRWLDITDEARQYEHHMRELTENAQFMVATLQQLAYISLVALGALAIGVDDFSMGALIACSILSGRILQPIAMIPSLLMQWAHTKVAVSDLDRLWQLPADHPEGTQPLIAPLQGQYSLSDIDMHYGGTLALRLPKLHIRAGERIAILGGIGSGKTSLLRLLSGMYKPQAGRVLLDGMELELIAKDCLSEHIGFVAQDGRLFAGTLRENLILGLNDPGDEALLFAARRTGLFDAAIAPHPKGLERDIHEGGQGLSGGQRQLVHFTRALLRQPRIWLLDEPTASMDPPLEQRVLQTLAEELQKRLDSTLILVTHKPQLLGLVQRVMVLANQQIVLDGPRDQVLQQLRQPAPPSAPAPSQAPTAKDNP